MSDARLNVVLDIEQDISSRKRSQPSQIYFKGKDLTFTDFYGCVARLTCNLQFQKISPSPLEGSWGNGHFLEQHNAIQAIL